MGRELSEMHRMNILLERVEQQHKLLSEKVMSLDQKIDHGLQEVRRDMETGFRDLEKGIAGLVKDVRNHQHGN